MTGNWGIRKFQILATMYESYFRWVLFILTTSALVSCGSFFQKIMENGKLLQDANDIRENALLGKDFFACDREDVCKFVVLYKTTNNFKLVESMEELEAFNDSVDVWEKFSAASTNHLFVPIIDQIPLSGLIIVNRLFK